MNRIFLPLCGLNWILLATTFVLGLQIGDLKVAELSVQRGMQYHFLTALGTLVFTTLVHVIVFTYFMGTGRWMEETSHAYRLDLKYYHESIRLKYRLCLAIVGVFLLLLFTGALGAAADPGSPVQFAGWFGLPAATIHQISAMILLSVNALVNYLEFLSLYRNGEIVDLVMQEVRRIRLEKGLAVEDAA